MTKSGGAIVCETVGLRLVIDASTGAITSLENRLTGHHLLDADEASAPWRLTPQGTRWRFMPGNVPPSYRFEEITPQVCTAVVEDGTAVIRWTTSRPGVEVRVDVRPGPGGAIELWPRVEVAEGTSPPLELVYPVVAGPRRLGDRDAAVFPSHSGWLVRDPFSRGPLMGSYPDGYHGCSVQCMAYIEEGRGGFYVATHDPHSTTKLLRMGADEISITHSAWDVRNGASMNLDYPIVLAPLQVGDWFEVAERYRGFALGAPWSSRGPRRERGEARWLFEEVGLNIWCTPSSLDWSEWYRHYAEVAGTPLHIVAGWDWPARRPHFLGYEGWFPARFHEANLAAWEGHHVTPYLNDLFVSTRAEGFLERWEPNLLFPYHLFAFLPFSEPGAGWANGGVVTPDPVTTTDVEYFLCPAAEETIEFHSWRDTKLCMDHELDGIFYDISSGNPMLWSRCLRTEHGHPPGRGRHIIDAYDRLNRASKDRMEAETGRYLVQGVETIIENLVANLDFYTARGCAGPMGVLEAWTLGPEEPPGGKRELVPLFEAIYHDVGPVREDGWLTLAADEGDLFYWVVARIVLRWGGIFSMHYANIGPERLPGVERSPAVVSWDGSVHTFDDLPEADEGKAGFVRRMAEARTTYGRPYISYGRMLRPPDIDVPSLDLGFRQTFPGSPGIVNEGTWPVPQVVHGAWLDEETGNAAVLLVNLHPDEPVTVAIDHPGEAWGLDLDGRTVQVRSGDQEAEIPGSITDGQLRMSLDLEPRVVYLVEVTTT